MTKTVRLDRVEETARNQIEKGHFSSVEWRVLRKGQVFSAGKLGWADANAQLDLPEKPLYRIFSMTKPIIGVAALMLMERGLIRLFDPLAQYLPEFQALEILKPDGERVKATQPIIIEHLMTHRAGFSYAFIPDCPVANLYKSAKLDLPSKSLAEFACDTASMPLAFEPGTQWRYSIATDILARVIEIASGQDLPTLLDELIFSPLGMAETGYVVPKDQQNRILPIFGLSDFDSIMDFAPGPQRLTPTDFSDRNPPDNPGFWRGGYGLFSTTDDYLKFLPVIASGVGPQGQRLLSRKTVELMSANRIPAQQMPLAIGPILMPGYGHDLLGRVMIDLGQALGLTSMGESGWAGAASTYFWIDKAEEMIGITMSQYIGSKIPLGDEMRRAVYQALDE